MKKLLLTAVATLVCFGVFAQGKLAFINNSDQLVYFTTEQTLQKGLAPLDVGKSVAGFTLAGSSLYTGAGSTIASLAGTPSIVARLFGGVTSDALSLQTTSTLGASALAGLIVQANSTFATLAPGVSAFFRIDIVDSRFQTAADAWLAGGVYGGSSGLFQAVPQTSVYSPIWQKTAPVNSTMPSGGPFVPLDYVGFAGYKGLIEVYATAVPEPGMFALAGLGAAVLMIFRRRK